MIAIASARKLSPDSCRPTDMSVGPSCATSQLSRGLARLSQMGIEPPSTYTIKSCSFIRELSAGRAEVPFFSDSLSAYGWRALPKNQTTFVVSHLGFPTMVSTHSQRLTFVGHHREEHHEPAFCNHWRLGTSVLGLFPIGFFLRAARADRHSPGGESHVG